MSTPYNGRSDEWGSSYPQDSQAGDEWGSYSQQNPPTQQFPPQGWDQPQQYDQPYQQPQYTQYDQYEPVQMQPTPAAAAPKKSNAALYAVIAVLAVALLALVGYMVLRGTGSPSGTAPAGSEEPTALFTEDRDEDGEKGDEKAAGEDAEDDSDGGAAEREREKATARETERETDREREPGRTSERERFGEDREPGRGRDGGRGVREREFGAGQPETSLTSDQFASAVGSDFRAYFKEHGEAPSSLRTYSSVTGLTYDMSCRAVTGGYRCTGGNNASVFIPEL